MKYIDADQIRAEIERRIENCVKNVKHQPCHRIEELCELLNFLDSLQQEPPINTELCTLIACDVIQATVKRAIEKPQDKDKEEDLMIKKMEYLNMLEKSLFQQEQMLKDDPVIMRVEDFQALIDSHAKRVEADYKEQMMKDAIEIEVKEDAGGYPYIDATELYDYENDKPLAKAGDKVKIIIVNEDKKDA